MTLGSKMGSVNLVPIVRVTGQGKRGRSEIGEVFKSLFPTRHDGLTEVSESLVKGNEDAGYEGGSVIASPKISDVQLNRASPTNNAWLNLRHSRP